MREAAARKPFDTETTTTTKPPEPVKERSAAAEAVPPSPAPPADSDKNNSDWAGLWHGMKDLSNEEQAKIRKLQVERPAVSHKTHFVAVPDGDYLGEAFIEVLRREASNNPHHEPLLKRLATQAENIADSSIRKDRLFGQRRRAADLIETM